MDDFEYEFEPEFDDELKDKYEELQIEWEIVDFYSQANNLTDIKIESKPFSFGITEWVIHLCLDRDTDNWRVFVTRDKYAFKLREMEMESEVAFKKVDGSLDKSLMLNDGEKYDGYYYIYSCANSDLLERKHEFTTSDSLTVVCSMKSGTSYYPEPTFYASPYVKLIGLDTLSENFKSLFASKGSSDVTLQVEDIAFKAHKAVLMARSSVFSAMFEHDMKEKETGIVNIHDCDPEFFHEFLEYVYCGKLESISFPSVLHLYAASDKYDCQELKSFCIQYMERSLAKDSVCDVMVLAEKYEEAKLLSLARRFFFKNVAEIVNTPKWKNLLENNSDLVNRLIIEMASKMNI